LNRDPEDRFECGRQCVPRLSKTPDIIKRSLETGREPVNVPVVAIDIIMKYRRPVIILLAAIQYFIVLNYSIFALVFRWKIACLYCVVLIRKGNMLIN